MVVARAKSQSQSLEQPAMDLNAVNYAGRTALHIAANKHHREVVAVLLEVKDPEGRSLEESARKHQVDEMTIIDHKQQLMM